MDLNNYINREIIASLRNISLAKAKVADVMPVSQNMRLPDIRECAIFGTQPFDCLMDAVINFPDETYTILMNERPVAMCGTSEYPNSKGNASVWMLGTNDIDKHYFVFLRGAKDCINILQADYKNIDNIVPVDHIKTIQWLKWCGFTFEEHIENHYGYDFLRFNRCNLFQSSIYNESSRSVIH